MGNNVGQLINRRGVFYLVRCGLRAPGISRKDADTCFESVGLGLGEKVFSERVYMSMETCCLNSHHKVYDM